MYTLVFCLKENTHAAGVQQRLRRFAATSPRKGNCMKRTIFLLGFCAALLLPPAAFADVPGVSREARQRMFEARRRAEAEARIARVMVQDAVGGVQFVFEIAGPGTCEYTLRGPQSDDDLGPVVAKSRLTAEGADKHVLKDKAVIAPETKENENGRYRLEALCRVRPVEQTNFGPKESGQVKEVRITRSFRLRRKSIYRVTS